MSHEQKYIDSYYLCQNVTEKFSKFLTSKGIKNKVTYFVGYLSYMREVDCNQARIELNVKGYKSCIVSFDSMLVDCDKMFAFNLWKYNGTHYDEEYRSDYIGEDDFDYYLSRVNSFFGFAPSKPVQMSLFDFLDADGNFV